MPTIPSRFPRCFGLLLSLPTCLITAQAQVVNWATATSGNWSDAARWSPATVPNGLTFDATIGVAGSAYTATLNQDASVNSLTLSSANATFAHSSGRTLTLGSTLSINAGIYNLAGTISGGSIVQGGGTLNFQSGGVLDGTTLQGNLNLGTNGRLTLRNGATFTGANANLVNGILTFGSSGSVAGKTITTDTLNQGALALSGTGTTLTLGAGTQYTGHTEISGSGTSQSVLNQGTISQTTIFGANISGSSGFTFTNNGTVTNAGSGTLTFGSNVNNVIINNGSMTATTGGLTLGGTSTATFTNAAGGTVSADGGTVTLGGGGSSWTNAGTLRALNGGTLNLGGNYTTAGLSAGTIQAAGGLARITGNLNNTAATLTAPATGVFTLGGGTIQGGQIAAGALAFSSSGGTLDAATLQDNLNLGANGRLTLLNGGTFTGANASLVSGTLTFGSPATLAGKTITTDTLNQGALALSGTGTTLTLGAGTQYTGHTEISGSGTSQSVLNQGTISQTTIFGANISGSSGFTFTNNGTVTNAGSGTLTFGSNTNNVIINNGSMTVTTGGLTLGGTSTATFTNAAGGTVSADGGTVTLGGGGSSWTNAGTLRALNGGTLNLGGNYTTAGLSAGTIQAAGGLARITGNLNNTAATLTAPATGIFTLGGGTIQEGQIAAGALAISSSGGTFDGATLQGDLNLGANGRLTLLNGGTFTGANASLVSGTLTFGSPATLAGKTITTDTLNQGALALSGTGTTLTLGAGTQYTGHTEISGSGTSQSVLNQGTISQTTIFGANISGSSGFTFTNNGTVTNAGNGTLTFGSNVNNVIINNGSMTATTGGLTLGGTSTATFTNAAGGTVSADGGTVTLGGGGSSWTNAGTLRALNGGTLNLGGNYTTAGLSAGTIQAAGGTARITGNLSNTAATLNAPASGVFTLAGGTVQGGQISAGALAFSGSGGTFDGATLQGDLNLGANGRLTLLNGGTFTGANASLVSGTLTFGSPATLAGKTITTDTLNQGALALSGTGTTLTLGAGTQYTGHTEISGSGTSQSVLNQGTISQTTIFGANISGSSGFTFTNNGTVTNAGSGTLTFGSNVNNVIINNGSMTATTGGLTLAATATATFTNAASGVVTANGNNAQITLSNSNITNLASNTLTGGTWEARSGGTVSFEGTSNAIITNSANLVLDGTGSTIRTRTGPSSTFQTVEQTLATNNGSLAVLGNRNFTATNALANNGTVQLGGGTLNAPSFTNSSTGELNGFGSVAIRPVNNGGVVLANGGTLTMADGIADGATAGSHVQVNAGATLNLSGGSSGSRADNLVVSGTLNLGSNTFTVDKDYNNTAGTGNSYNARAGVTGSGAINASGDTAQVVTGPLIFNGSSATPTLNLGNSREGQNVTTTYNVVNSGVSGADLRGALQTSVNGGNITDTRLTGSGVTAGNFGPIASGGSQNYTVNFNASTAGAITGQVVHIANNFDNVADQNLSIIGGGVYRPAAANTIAPNPANLGNARVGGTLSTTFGISNVAGDTGGYTETLNASVTGTTGAASGNGSISGLAFNGGASNAISGSLSTATVGAKNGSVTIGFTSTEVGGSGLGTIGVGSQTVNLSGNVYRLAEAALGTLDFGNVLVGSSQTRFLSVSNTALADGFSEGLNASLGSFTGASAGLLQGSGSINNLAAGASNNTTLAVTLNTNNAGGVTANVQVLLASNGAGTSGLGVFDLPSQSVPINGLIQANVGNLASASAVTPNPVNLGNVRVGAVAPAQALSLTNTQVGPAEGLNASISTATTGLTATGSFTGLAPGATNNSSLAVGMTTTTAGSRNGTATITLVSDGSFNSGVPTPLGSQTVNVTGAVYQPAAANTLTSPVNLGNARVGGTLSTALGVTNVAPNTSGFTETLGASVTGTTGGVQTSGSVSGLAQGASSSAITAGFSTATAGAKTGSATIGFTSTEINGSGLGTIGVGSQTVNLSGNVYRTAEATLGTIDFGNVLAGSLQQRFLSVTNSAVADGFSEGLNASLGGFSGTSAGLLSNTGGVITNLAAGQSNNSTLAVSLNTGATGPVSASVQVLLQSNGAGTSGLGLLDLAAQSVPITGLIQANVGNLAAASAATPNPVNFGNVRVGAPAPSQALTISNTIQIGEGLNASIATATSGLTAAGTITSLAPGATNSSSLVVGMNTATAGSRNGTATLTLASDGSFNNGVVTPLSPQVVNVTGGVFRLADGSVAPETMVLNARVGAVASTALTMTNAAAADGFSEGLRASAGATTGAASASGTSALIAAGSSGGGITVSLNTATAGAKAGTATINYQSDGLGTSGLSAIAAGSDVVSISGSVYQPAQANTLPGTVNLGTVRTGTVVNTPLSISNVAALTGGFTETLGAGFGTTSSALVGTGNISGLAAGDPASNALSLQFTAGSPGAFNGSATVNFVSQEINGSGLGNLALPSQTLNVSASVNALAAFSLTNQSAFSYLSTGANSAVLDFGTITSASILNAPFLLSNSATGQSDSLLAAFALAGLANTPFSLVGAGNFELAAGVGQSFSILFSPTQAGSFSATFGMNFASHNAFQSDLDLGTFAVTLRGQFSEFTPPSTVPDSPIGMLGALTMLSTLALGHVYRRRQQADRR